MSIRNRLTLQFVLLASLVLGMASFAIYFQSAVFRKEEFYTRLDPRIFNATKLLLESDAPKDQVYEKLELSNPVKLTDESMVLLDANLNVLFSSGDSLWSRIDTSLINRVKRDIKIRYSSGEREGLGILQTLPKGQFYAFISANDLYGRRKISNLIEMLLLTNFSALVLMLFLGRAYAERALNPLKRLVSQVQSINERNLSTRVSEGNGKDEIAQLAASFNAMLGRLEGAFRSQRSFIANASHEMRTPLTAISGQLEVLLLKDRNSDEYKKAVSSVIDDIRSLSNTTNRLLMLAQAGSEQTVTDFAPVRVDEALWQARTDLLKMNPGYKVTVVLDGVEDIEVLSIQGNEQLIRSVVLNLMENACKYSSDHQAHVKIGLAEKNLQIVVSDHGIGIPPQDLKAVTEPFYRGTNTHNITGHGLGLSLVKRIIELHGGTIVISSVLGKGTEVKVSLPCLSPNNVN